MAKVLPVNSVSMSDNYSHGGYTNGQKAQAEIAEAELKKTTAEITEDFMDFIDSAVHMIDAQV